MSDAQTSKGPLKRNQNKSILVFAVARACKKYCYVSPKTINVDDAYISDNAAMCGMAPHAAAAPSGILQKPICDYLPPNLFVSTIEPIIITCH
jgi:hypothetical protein